MSRIGKLPIPLPSGVIVTVDSNNLVKVKGQLGELEQIVHKDIIVEIKDNEILVSRPDDEKSHRSMHGLYRSLIKNMVEGVSKGYEIKLELVGVGYKAEAKERLLELALGFSHNIIFQLPTEVSVEAVTERRSNPVITLKSTDKQLIGHVAAKIRSFRKPEPYKGKGIRFVGENVRKKAGKTAGM